MTPTLSGYAIALAMVATSAALIFLFLRGEAVASATRMMRMMARCGLVPWIAAHGSPATAAVMRDARRHCTKCRIEGFCERWLGGEVGGDNTFCPNAPAFRKLRDAGDPAS